MYYKLANGFWVDRDDIKQAFYISTGRKYSTDSKEFVRWLFPLLGKSIVSVKRSDDPELITELLNCGQKVFAMKVYKDIHDCTLKEARDAIERMIADESI